jgi:dipeptidase D
MPDSIGVSITVNGLRGGHSGLQIHECRANAIKLLTEVLLLVEKGGIDFRIASFSGGSADNAIPRRAVAHIATPLITRPEVERLLRDLGEVLYRPWKANEPEMNIQVEQLRLSQRVLTNPSGESLLRLLTALPHGVLKWSQVFSEKPETSANLAEVQIEGETVQIITSSRSFIASELNDLLSHIRLLSKESESEIEIRDSYPAWEPDPSSRILRVATDVHKRLFGRAPAVDVMHAGLECGAIVSRIPQMEAISFGCLIKDAHTPNEHVHASTVLDLWRLLSALLSTIASPERQWSLTGQAA